MWLPLQSVTVSELSQGDLELDDALVVEFWNRLPDT